MLIKQAKECGIDEFIFCHDGSYYIVEWRMKGTALEYWSKPIEIEKL